MSAMSARPASTPGALHRPGVRSILLFLDFFLIILAYYQVKPASRSLFLEYANARDLPYLWAGSAALLLMLMPLYQRLLRTFTRLDIVLGTCGAVLGLLVLFRILLLHPNLPTAIGFYLLVDVFSVVLVEQFWSLTNSVLRGADSPRWYGLIASGGLMGGLVGGLTASWLVAATPLVTPDLLLVSAGIIGLMLWLTLRLARHGLYDEPPVRAQAGIVIAEAWQALRANPYLSLIATMLLLSQICEPIVEYQFMHLVEQTYVDAEERTAYLSRFFSVLSGAALAVNLVVTPLVLRGVGALGGLLVQPMLLGAAAAAAFASQSPLSMAAFVKVCDRGLSYSINRTSRELIYARLDAVTIYRAKAWIDMVGYRTFKLVGIATILLLTQWLPWAGGDASLSLVVIVLCGAWVWAALRVGVPGLRAAGTPEGATAPAGS